MVVVVVGMQGETVSRVQSSSSPESSSFLPRLPLRLRWNTCKPK